MVCAQATRGTTRRKKRTRTIVNVSSVDGSIATNRTAEIGEQAGMQLAYCSSKAALNMRALQRSPLLTCPASVSRVHGCTCRRMRAAQAFSVDSLHGSFHKVCWRPRWSARRLAWRRRGAQHVDNFQL